MKQLFFLILLLTSTTSFAAGEGSDKAGVYCVADRFSSGYLQESKLVVIESIPPSKELSVFGWRGLGKIEFGNGLQIIIDTKWKPLQNQLGELLKAEFNKHASMEVGVRLQQTNDDGLVRILGYDSGYVDNSSPQLNNQLRIHVAVRVYSDFEKSINMNGQVQNSDMSSWELFSNIAMTRSATVTCTSNL